MPACSSISAGRLQRTAWRGKYLSFADNGLTAGKVYFYKDEARAAIAGQLEFKLAGRSRADQKDRGGQAEDRLPHRSLPSCARAYGAFLTGRITTRSTDMPFFSEAVNRTVTVLSRVTVKGTGLVGRIARQLSGPMRVRAPSTNT